MAEDWSLPLDGKTALDGLPPVKDILKGDCDNVHVVVCVDPTWDSQPEKVEAIEPVLVGDWVSVSKKVTNFNTADAGLQIQLDCQSLGRELLLRDVSQNLRCVNEDGVTTSRPLIWNAELIEPLGKVGNLLDPGLKVVELGVLIETDSKGVHVSAGHTTIGEVTFIADAEALRTLVPLFNAGSDETTHVDDGVLLGTHGHTIGVLVHFPDDFLDCLVLVALFTDLDEVRVLGKPGAVEDDWLLVLVADGTDIAQVLHGNWLATSGVVCDCDNDEWNAIAVLLENLLQFRWVDVALEWNFELRVLGLVNCAVDCVSLAGFDVAFGRVEVGVAWNVVAFLHKVAEENVFGGTALVGWEDVLEAEELLDHFLEVEEGAGAGVGLVTHHDASPLAV